MQTDNRHAPFGALSPVQRQVCSVFVLALFFITYNSGVVFYSVRGVPPGHVVLSASGYLSGVILSALLFDAFFGGGPGSDKKRGDSRLLTVLLVVLLLPGLFCLFSFQMVSPAGNLFLNIFQPFLWGMGLPVAHRLFFQYSEPARQALWFGLAVSAGYVCWSLLAMATGLLAVSGQPVVLSGPVLTFINLMRAASNSAFALLAWLLVRRTATLEPVGQDAATGAPERMFPSGPGGSVKGLSGVLGLSLARILLPFLLCYMLNGMMKYLLFVRFPGNVFSSEYIHLVLALLLPLMGLALSRVGSGLLLSLMGVSLPLVIMGALAGYQTGPSGFGGVTLLVGWAAFEVSVFAGTLALAPFSARSRHPSLVIGLIWLCMGASVPGSLLASKLLPILSVPVFPVACVLAGLCLLSLLVLRRAFPLPEAPGAPEISGSEFLAATRAEEARLEALRLEAKVKQRAFAAAHGLSSREMEILAGILVWKKRDAIAAELGISENTAKFHIRNLLQKTGQLNRQRLLHFYAEWKVG